MNKPKLDDATRLFDCAHALNLQPEWLQYRKIFAIQTESGEQYINWTFSSLNPNTAIIQTRNKYMTRIILERHGLSNIPYALPKNIEEGQEFFDAHQDIIAKPINGWGSHNIHHITDAEDLSNIDYPKFIFERYTPGNELRFLVLRGELIAVHQSIYGDSVAVDRKLQRISIEPDQWDPELSALAIQIAKIFGLGLAAVDFMIDATGHAYVLEVNDAPGLKWFHRPTSGPPVDVARLLLEATISQSTEYGTLAGEFLAS